MWSNNRSLTLSKCCVIAFMALLALSVVVLPLFFGSWLVDIAPAWRFGTLSVHHSATQQLWFFRITIYTGAVPAAVILIMLYRLLDRIGKGEIFTKKNVDCLRCISWCCFAGALVSLISTYYWVPWSAIAIAAAFMGLIVRVVKNVIAKASELQDDVDHTI